jgi:protein ImuA
MALHEIAGSRIGCVRSAFAAGSPPARAAKCSGVSRVWTRSRRLSAQAGLNCNCVIYLEGGDKKTILAGFEEGLRHGGLGTAGSRLRA